MDGNTLPEEVLNDLRMGCGMEPSVKLRNMVARFLNFLHRGTGGPVRYEVLAMLAAIANDVKYDSNPAANPFADTEWGTPLTVLRQDSKEVLCNGFWMGCGEGMMSHLVKVAMHDNEQEAQDFDFRQVRLRDELPVQMATKETGPIRVIPDPVEEDEPTQQEPAVISEEQPAAAAEHSQSTTETNSEVEIEDTSIPPEVVEPSQWNNIGEGSLVWMEDGSDGEFLGVDSGTGFLKVRVDGKHTGNKYSLYAEDQVRIAEAIPVEHDPVEVGAK